MHLQTILTSCTTEFNLVSSVMPLTSPESSATTGQKKSSLSNQSRMPWPLSNNDGKLSQISSLFHRDSSDWSKFWSLVCSKNETDGEISGCDEAKSWLKTFGESAKHKHQQSHPIEMNMHLKITTPCLKKRAPFYFYENFVRCRPIFITLSLADSENLQ